MMQPRGRAQLRWKRQALQGMSFVVAYY
jgi:hypothetical protein